MGKINETSAAGSTGAGSIATVPSNRLGGMQTRMNLKDFMVKFNNSVVNRYAFAPVPEGLTGSIKSITESAGNPYQLDDAVSRLKNMQTQGDHDDKDVVTYGIRDDGDNLMLLTVPVQQGEDFERSVAQSLADVMQYKKTGKGENKTLAELLYDLKDQFTIVNAEFPAIPKNAVYNADAVSEDNPEMGDDDMDDEMDPNDDMNDDMDDDMDDAEPDPDMDDGEVGDDFAGGDDKESLLTAVLGMLKSQNEKETAQARASEETAKAKQSKMALQSSKDEMKNQESVVAAEAEMDAVKEKDKRAKKMAELAKFNYRKKKGMGEGFSSLFKSAILEIDSNDTTRSLQQQKRVINTKYRSNPDDTDETNRFRQKEQSHAMRELRIKQRAAKDREDFEKRQNMDAPDTDTNNDEEQGQDGQQQGNRPQGNRPQ